MKRLLHLVLLGSVMTATLGGCYVADRPVGYARAPRVWVPAHWHHGVWVGGHWRYA
jgi:hypothetical protein